MTRKRNRAASYPRVSNPNMEDSATLASQSDAIKAYCQRMGYQLEEQHIYPEAETAYYKSFQERPHLMRLLEDARKGLFDVVVVNEFSRLSRKQVEQAVIIDHLQKAGCRIESVTEKYEDSTIGHFMRSVYAFHAEIERDKIMERTARGRRSRAENGNLTGQGRPTYGYQWIDTDREQKARYIPNHTPIHISEDGTIWTEVKVIVHIFDLARSGMSLRQIARKLTGLGIPTQRGKPFWTISTIHVLLTNRYYIGDARVYRLINTDTIKHAPRPYEEQIQLPAGVVPPLVSVETFEAVQEQLARNKQEAARNNRHPNDALLRAGLVQCGVCQHIMWVQHHEDKRAHGERKPRSVYTCRINTGVSTQLDHYHIVTINVPILDALAWEFAVEHIQNPALVRQRVADIQAEQHQMIDSALVFAEIEKIKRKMSNLRSLAEDAIDDDVIADLKGRLLTLSKEKRQWENLLEEVSEQEEQAEQIQEALCKFEAWTDQVRPLLSDPNYEPTYEEKRMACLILGIRATIYPANGDKRYELTLAPPKVVSVLTWRFSPIS